MTKTSTPLTPKIEDILDVGKICADGDPNCEQCTKILSEATTQLLSLLADVERQSFLAGYNDGVGSYAKGTKFVKDRLTHLREEKNDGTNKNPAS